VTPAGSTISMLLTVAPTHGARGHVLPLLQIAGNCGHQTPYQGFAHVANWGTSVPQIPRPYTITEGPWTRQFVRNHRAPGDVPPTFTNDWARTAKWDKQETDQNVLPLTKALAKMTNCTPRAKNLNNFLYKNKSATLVAVG